MNWRSRFTAAPGLVKTTTGGGHFADIAKAYCRDISSTMSNGDIPWCSKQPALGRVV